jgi:hypothetical protein
MPPGAQTDVGWIPKEARKKLKEKEKAEKAAQENGGTEGKAEANGKTEGEAKAETDGAKKEDT